MPWYPKPPDRRSIEILKKKKIDVVKDGGLKGERYVAECATVVIFYPDGIAIDDGDNVINLENKYIPRLIKLLEKHAKEVKL